MAYNEFSLEQLKQRFGIRIEEATHSFASVPPAPIGDVLREVLRENVPLALAISTEKARSEMIIAPILIEVRRQLQRSISLFSGVEFTVDPARGLKGVCDYVLSLSAEQLMIEAPVIAVVEAKNENMKQGINQCIAEMIAAQIFNTQRDNSITTVYGVVTTGTNWKFLRLSQTNVSIDLLEYYIDEPEKIVGIIMNMVSQARIPNE